MAVHAFIVLDLHRNRIMIYFATLVDYPSYRRKLNIGIAIAVALVTSARVVI